MTVVHPIDEPATRSDRASTLPRSILMVAFLSASLLGLGAAYGRYRLGSLAAALAFVRGDRILVDEPHKSVLGVQPGASVTLRYSLKNLTRRPIRIIGQTTSCACSAVDEIPFTLAAWGSRTISATTTLSEEMPGASGTIRLFTDDVQSPEIILAYTVRADSPSDTR